jgi:hypothetical protein
VYVTSWIPSPPLANSSQFLRRSFAYHVTRALPQRLRHTRTPAVVQARYDAQRGEAAARLQSTDWAAYTRFPDDLCDFTLLDDQVRWGPLRVVRDRMIEHLHRAVAPWVQPGRTVIEFGSGDGRNLLVLGRAFPEMRFVGLELSPVSVELSRQAATHFGVSNVQFESANVCQPITVALPAAAEVTFVFSFFALEMMPRIFPGAIEAMLTASSGGVSFFEPVSEVWSRDLRGLTSRLRVFQLDRLAGFTSALRKAITHSPWRITAMRRTGVGLNPLNEMSEVHLERTH